VHGQYRKILARQQPIKLRNSPKQLPAIYIKEYLHFLGLTFTVCACQNKYLAAMQRNKYRYVDAAVHVVVSAFICITDGMSERSRL
jgi:hypothetical protein